MSENWQQIAAEVADALASVGFAATLTRPATVQTSPWDAAQEGAKTTYAVTVLDSGIKDRYVAGSLVTRQVRVLKLASTGVVPAKSDRITVRGVEHEIGAVMPLAPGGIDLMFEIEVSS